MRRFAAVVASFGILLTGGVVGVAPVSADTVGKTRLTFENPVVIRNPLGARADYTVRIDLRPQQCVTFTALKFRAPSGQRYSISDYREKFCANRNGVLRVSGWVQFRRSAESGTWLAKLFWKNRSGIRHGSYDYFTVINRTK